MRKKKFAGIGDFQNLRGTKILIKNISYTFFQWNLISYIRFTTSWTWQQKEIIKTIHFIENKLIYFNENSKKIE